VKLKADASGAPPIVAPVVKGWKGTTLKNGGRTEICLWFPAYTKAGSYPAELILLLRGDSEPGEKFGDCTIDVGEPSSTGMGRPLATVAALVVAAIVFLLASIVSRRTKRSFLQSPDGRYSVSRFQVIVWTVVVLASYVYLYLFVGTSASFPDSVWVLMGISVGSLGSAKFVASSQLRDLGGGVAPAMPAPAGQLAGGALASMLSDDGAPSLMRLQLLVWTIVASAIFLRQVWTTSILWDVPSGLLVLMGISHGGYLLDKVASAPPSLKVQSLQPSQIALAANGKNQAAIVTIIGLNFDPQRVVCEIGGVKLDLEPDSSPIRLVASLPVDVLPPGEYDLVVQMPGQDAEILSKALEIK
jgi:hypothetical protein